MHDVLMRPAAALVTCGVQGEATERMERLLQAAAAAVQSQSEGAGAVPVSIISQQMQQVRVYIVCLARDESCASC